MFAKNRHSEAASEAWHELRGLAAERAKDLGETARSKFTDVGDETRRRAVLAWDVLAGHPARASKWPMVRAGLLGVALGWGAAELYRRRKQEVNEAVAQLSNELRDAKTSFDDRIAKAKATPGSPIDKAKAVVTPTGTTGTLGGNNANSVTKS